METETITVLSAGTVLDPYSGREVESWDTASERQVTTVAPPEPRPTGVSAGVGGNGEPVLDARNSVTSGWTLYLPPGDPITAQNRVRVRGIDYPVQGQPSDWGVGVVVQAYRVEG